MDLTKVYSYIKKTKSIMISDMITADGTYVEQWISNGVAAYSLSGLPQLDHESVLLLIGVDTESKAKYNVYEHNFSHSSELMKAYTDTDRSVIPTGLTIAEYEVLEGGSPSSPDIVFVNAAALKVFGDDVEYIYRQLTDKQAVILVKSGLITIGCILPYTFPDNAHTDKIRERLDKISKKLSEATASNSSCEDEQLSFDN